jgi:hypothetical protein
MSTVMMDRLPSGNANVFGASNTAPSTANACILPRCTFKFEKCQGGIKIHCCCDARYSF